VKGDADYFTDEAPNQDLEGNLDAYAMVTGGGGAKGLESMLQMPGTSAPGTPVSQVLAEYFVGSGRMAVSFIRITSRAAGRQRKRLQCCAKCWRPRLTAAWS